MYDIFITVQLIHCMILYSHNKERKPQRVVKVKGNEKRDNEQSV